MEWLFNKKTFKMDSYYPGFIQSPWVGHRDFAYDLITFMEPRSIVELGTAYGTSLFSFAQAIKENQISCTCHAIDTWEGDEHSGYYGEEVFQLVSKIQDEEHYNFIQKYRMRFDDAASLFPTESIDLLHIDGLHTYEAVSHDYETWIPKLSENGAVLFHDISVVDRGFGVYKLWSQLAERYPHISFGHSNGLGVLFPKGSAKFNPILQIKHLLSQHYELASQNFRLAIEYTVLSNQTQGLSSQFNKWESMVERASKEIERLNHENTQLKMKLNG